MPLPAQDLRLPCLEARHPSCTSYEYLQPFLLPDHKALFVHRAGRQGRGVWKHPAVTLPCAAGAVMNKKPHE